MRIFVLAIASVLCGIGCDDSSSGNSSNDTESDTNQGNDTESGTGDPQGTDAGTDSGQVTDGQIFPHTVGSWWRYRYEKLITTDDYIPCGPGEWTGEFTAMENVDGRDVYTYINPCVAEGASPATILYTFTGDRTEMLQLDSIVLEPGDYYLTDSPVEADHSWEAPHYGYTYRWEFTGTVTVEAGTFSDCWTRTNDDKENELVFCRGVGRVSGETAGQYRSELIDYHLE